MVRIAAAAVLAFAVSAMALSSDGTPANAAVLRTRQDAEAPPAEKPKEETPEEFKKWLLTVAEAADELRKMVEEVANGDAGKAN
ncbi:hypothetical protein A9K55_008886 [Cordyceps militaris]|uniref:Uncharacterized protein n=1 Tax=Cordyceps militaris TaxID=73501 RepID=A0A2H4SEB4_CORMI|nr:hypothetical protein A9K55_008886 [Cordyceps militaris]